MSDDLHEFESAIDKTLATMPPLSRPRVYLAGPDVFERDARGAGDRLKALCALEGLEGVYPLDGPVDMGGPPAAVAHRIFLANVRLIQSCAGVLVNMNPFRGPSMDVGTAWETGYAFARGLCMIGYTADVRAYAARANHYRASLVGDAVTLENGLDVEDFGLLENLMIPCSVRRVVSTPAEAARQMALALSLDVPRG